MGILGTTVLALVASATCPPEGPSPQFKWSPSPGADFYRIEYTVNGEARTPLRVEKPFVAFVRFNETENLRIGDCIEFCVRAATEEGGLSECHIGGPARFGWPLVAR